MGKIKNIIARQIIDSRGNPTVEAEVYLNDGSYGRAAVPSGASTGKYEAVELRDNDPSFYNGKSVFKAVSNIKSIISPELIGLNVDDQKNIDNILLKLDGTENKSNLGANSMLAVSLACAKAAANYKKTNLFSSISEKDQYELPIPMMNILNGGSHADNKIDFQEFMVMPVGADTFSNALQMGTEIFHALKNELKSNGYSTNVGDEGGFAPNLSSNHEAIEIVLKSVSSAGFTAGKDIFIAIDAAASEFYNSKENVYHFHQSTGEKLSPSEMVDFWNDWINKYPIISIEDGLDEDDWDAWKLMTEKMGENIQLVGDDLFVTNVKKLSKGIDEKVANSILIKVNQIGTLTETINAVELAQKNSYTSIMSHRSGETEDTTIADLSVALQTGQIKTGSASRSDRVAKYNQLLRIEENLGKKAVFTGKGFKFFR